MDIEIRTKEKILEVSWFSDLCNGDFEYLGVMDSELRSSFSHCKDIVLKAEEMGFKNILLPSSYQTGQDTLTFAAAIAPMTKSINLRIYACILETFRFCF